MVQDSRFLAECWLTASLLHGIMAAPAFCQSVDAFWLYRVIVLVSAPLTVMEPTLSRTVNRGIQTLGRSRNRRHKSTPFSAPISGTCVMRFYGPTIVNFKHRLKTFVRAIDRFALSDDRLLAPSSTNRAARSTDTNLSSSRHRLTV